MFPIIIVPKKNEKLKNCIDFRKLNVATKKDPYPLPFTDEMLNIVIGYEEYFFLDGYLRYHQISIALKDRYKTGFVTYWGGFYMEGDTIWNENGPPTYQKAVTKTFKEYLDNF